MSCEFMHVRIHGHKLHACKGTALARLHAINAAAWYMDLIYNTIKYGVGIRVPHFRLKLYTAAHLIIYRSCATHNCKLCRTLGSLLISYRQYMILNFQTTILLQDIVWQFGTHITAILVLNTTIALTDPKSLIQVIMVFYIKLRLIIM